MAFSTATHGRLESCLSLNAQDMQKKGAFVDGRSGTWQWTDNRAGKSAGLIGYEYHEGFVHLDFRCNDQPQSQRITIDRTACTYGGYRLWFICPVARCRNRVGSLYLRGGLFACRHCQRLNYNSQQAAKSEQPRLRLQAVRRRLNWPLNGDIPIRTYLTRPKGMHRKTFDRLRDEHNQRELEYLQSFGALLNRLGCKIEGINS